MTYLHQSLLFQDEFRGEFELTGGHGGVGGREGVGVKVEQGGPGSPGWTGQTETDKILIDAATSLQHNYICKPGLDQLYITEI